MTRKKNKKEIFVSFVEEAVLNNKYDRFIGGRIEIYYPQDYYASEEIRFFTKNKEEFYNFREKWDFKMINEKQLNYIKKIVKTKFNETNLEECPMCKKYDKLVEIEDGIRVCYNCLNKKYSSNGE